MESNCLNCGDLQTVPFPACTNALDLHTSLNKAFGCTLKSDSLESQSELEFCENCNSTFTLFYKSKNNFLLKTKRKSTISRIIETVEQKKTENSKEIGKVLPPAEKCDGNLNSKNSDTMRNPLFGENGMQSTNGVDYQELTLQLKIHKLVLTESNVSLINCGAPNIPRVYLCDRCSRQFKSKMQLEKHVAAAHGTASVLCNFCDKKFIHNWFYKNHLKARHDGVEIVFSCLFCKKQCGSQKELDEHKFSVHRLTSHPFKCNHCDVAYETVKEIELLRTHLIECHKDTKEAEAAKYNAEKTKIQAVRNKMARSGKPMNCELCEKVLDNAKARYTHILFAHNEQKFCHICEETFVTEAEFEKHIVVTLHKQTKCNKCQKCFRNSTKLVRHLLYSVQHLNTELLIVCEICGTRFSNLERLGLHYGWHSTVAGPRNYCCSQCDKSFAMKPHLAIHMRNVHSKDTKEIQCKHCKKLFKPIFLKRHILQSHTDKKSYKHKCNECGMTFRTSAGLIQHSRIHKEPESSFNSDFVNLKSTPKSLAALKHIVYVNVDGETKFQCSECKKLFTKRDHIYEHLHRWHLVPTGEQNGNSTSFKLLKDKTPHMQRKKRKEKIRLRTCLIPFKCTLCEYTCVGINDIRNHFVSTHEDSKEAKAAANNLKKVKDDCRTRNEKNFLSEDHDYTDKSANVCLPCKTTFPTIFEKDQHSYITHKIARACKICAKTYDSEISLRNHLNNEHTVFPCKLCESDVLSSVEDFFAHLQENHITRLLICEFCGKYFKRVVDNHRHYRNFHDNSPPQEFLCHICGDSFSSTYLRQCHRRKMHWKERTKSKSAEHLCKKCNSKFNRKDRLYEHLELVHKIAGTIKCEECGDYFYSTNSLRSHRAISHPKSAFSGGDPKKKSFMSYYSEEHKMHKCPSCEFLSPSRYAMRDHVRFCKKKQTSLKMTGNKTKSKRIATKTSRKILRKASSSSSSSSSDSDEISDNIETQK